MENNIFALIVIYNKSCSESISYNCLKNKTRINIIVCDNSNSDFGNKDLVLGDNHTYINMGGNEGLSKAYNKALEPLRNEKGILCIFDDDTEILDNYFEELKTFQMGKDWDILLPQVLCENGLMSPVHLKKYAIKKINDIDNINYKYIAGINSGMAINLSLLENYQYDENLFLDFVDFNFILDMRKKNAKIKIMNTKLKQLFSIESSDKKAAKARLEIKKKDLRYFYRKTFMSRIYCLGLLLKLKVRLIIKFKDVGVLWW